MKNATRETTIRLFGAIGGAIDGDKFANDLAALDGTVDTINLHINSPGGSVSQGYSIVSVMLSMKSHINVYVVGIAASMAAVIAVCGKKVYMYDYSKLMIHDPFFSGQNTAKLTDKDKAALSQVTDSLQTILSRRGKDKKETARLMRSETWFGAEEAKGTGLIDEIISTKRKEELSGLSSNDIFNRICAEYSPNSNNNSKSNDMDLLQQLASILGLDSPTEEMVIQAVKDLVSDHPSEGVKEKLDNALKKRMIDEGNYDNLLEMGNKAPEALNGYLGRLEVDYKAGQEKRIDDLFIENRKKFLFVRPADKLELRKLAEADFDQFVRIVNILPDRKLLSQEIEDARDMRAGKSSWTLDDYRKNAPEELRNNPQLYKKLIDRESL